jgi:uncharacterized protein (DUF1778 family)
MATRRTRRRRELPEKFYVTGDERELIEKAAQIKRVTRSEYSRRTVLAQAERDVAEYDRPLVRETPSAEAVRSVLDYLRNAVAGEKKR